MSEHRDDREFTPTPNQQTDLDNIAHGLDILRDYVPTEMLPQLTMAGEAAIEQVLSTKY